MYANISTQHFNGVLYAYYQNNDLNGIRKTYDYMIEITKQQKQNINESNRDNLHKLMKMSIKPDKDTDCNDGTLTKESR